MTISLALRYRTFALRGLLALLFASPVWVSASTDPTYYIGSPKLQDLWVDPAQGRDDNSGGARDQALRTIAAAWERIPHELTDRGFRIRLVAGNYAEADLPVYWEQRRGTVEAPIVLEAADGPRTVHLRGNLSIFDVRYFYLIGLDIDNEGDVFHCEQCDHLLLRQTKLTGGVRQAHETIKINQSRYVYIEDSEIGEAYENAIDFVAVQHGHIVRNRIHDSDDWCMYLKGGSAYFDIEGNHIHDCGTGGFSAGQGTGFEYMVTPWLHYEAYDIRFVNNVVARTEGAGMGVNGGYDILLAYNTLYQVGQRSHVLEFVFGSRSCDGDDSLPGRCASHLAAGGWGTSSVGTEGEPIPNRNVLAYNNVLDNPPGMQSQWQHFAIYGERTPSPGSNIPTPARTDDHLQIRGNLIWNGPADHPLGIAEDSGCQPSNPTCTAAQLLLENRINVTPADLTDPEGEDYRPTAGGSAFAVPALAIPDFPAWDGLTPSVPPGDLRNAVGFDHYRVRRSPDGPIGAFARSDSKPALAAATGEIFGTVTDGEHNPIAAARVTLYRKNAAGRWRSMAETTTDPLGGYQFAGLRARAYRLRCQAPGFRSTFYPGAGNIKNGWNIALPRATTLLIDLTLREP